MSQHLNVQISTTRCKLDGLSCFEHIFEDKLKLLIGSTLLVKEPFKQSEKRKKQLFKYVKLFKDGKAP